MPSFKHIVLALASFASYHVTVTTASPAQLRARSENAPPTGVFAVVPSGVPSGSFPGLAKPTAAFTAPVSAVPGGANGTGPCDDMPGNHNRNHTHPHHHGHHHHNLTGDPSLDFDNNCTDLPTPTLSKAPASLITPPPDATAATNAKAAKFVQTTYYSCVTIGPDSHCGWHTPILDASTSNAADGLDVDGKAWLSLAGLVGVVVLLL